MLGRILRDILRPAPKRTTGTDLTRRVLNVGGGNKAIPIPAHYGGWHHLLLDIDAKGNPDIVCDARSLRSLPANQFDAVYCSHNLEHYYRHHVFDVLRGMLHLLKPGGFVEILVPDLQIVMKHMLETGMDLDDTLYQSPAGPIAVMDVVYGFGKEIQESGQDFYAHKTGFTPKVLESTLLTAGFEHVYVYVAREAFEVRALAFKGAPPAETRRLLGLPPA